MKIPTGVADWRRGESCRSIACAELFLRFSKTLIIEEEMKDLEEARAEAVGVEPRTRHRCWLG